MPLFLPQKGRTATKAYFCPHVHLQLQLHYSLFLQSKFLKLTYIHYNSFLPVLWHISVRLSLPSWNRKCSCHYPWPYMANWSTFSAYFKLLSRKGHSESTFFTRLSIHLTLSFFPPHKAFPHESPLLITPHQPHPLVGEWPELSSVWSHLTFRSEPMVLWLFVCNNTFSLITCLPSDLYPNVCFSISTPWQLNLFIIILIPI